MGAVSRQAVGSAAEPVRILIGNDEPAFRDGLRLLLEAEQGHRVVGLAANGTEAIELVRQLHPDILLLDFDMPGHTVLEAVRQLRYSSPPVRIILLAASLEKAKVLQAARFGARGVVLKRSTNQMLHSSIRNVMAGQYWLEDESVPDLVQSLRERGAAQSAEGQRKAFHLTPRELEIVAAIVAGRTNKEIAQRFSLSEQTVKHHLSNIFDKTGVSDRLELALFAIHHRLVRSLELSTDG